MARGAGHAELSNLEWPRVLVEDGRADKYQTLVLEYRSEQTAASSLKHEAAASREMEEVLRCYPGHAVSCGSIVLRRIFLEAPPVICTAQGVSSACCGNVSRMVS